jgi:ketosteroid isomerase-like protein
MTSLRPLALALLLVACATAHDDGPPTPVPAAEAAARPTVRQQLEQAYEVNRQALLAKDLAAVLALRTPNFEVVTPDGAVHDAEEMAGFTRNLLDNLVSWEALSFDILSLAAGDGEVAAEVRQHSIRNMRRDGTVRRIENWVTQRETWVLGPDGWRIRRVDNIRDQRVLIDGVPRP